MATFGRTPTFQSSDEIDFAVSDDGRAFTLLFVGSGFELDTGASEAPIATRLFSLVVPIEGDDERVEIEFIAGASVTLFDGATAASVLSVNGQSVVADLSAQDPAQDSETVLKYAADRPSECRLAFLLLAGRDSKNPNSNAVLAAQSIDAEFLPRAPGPQGPPVPPPEA
jgi:hypothetical protein